MRGFSTNWEQIRVLFKEHNIAAMCLQETKLGNRSPNVGSSYAFYRSPPLVGVRAQGGTGIIVHKAMNHRVVQLNTITSKCCTNIHSLFFVFGWIQPWRVDCGMELVTLDS